MLDRPSKRKSTRCRLEWVEDARSRSSRRFGMCLVSVRWKAEPSWGCVSVRVDRPPTSLALFLQPHHANSHCDHCHLPATHYIDIRIAQASFSAVYLRPIEHDLLQSGRLGGGSTDTLTHRFLLTHDIHTSTNSSTMSLFGWML